MEGMVNDLCHRCLLEPARRDGLGAACLRYQQRHGHPRPARLIVRHAERVSYRAAVRAAQRTVDMADVA